jgi:hypothetical protein
MVKPDKFPMVVYLKLEPKLDKKLISLLKIFPTMLLTKQLLFAVSLIPIYDGISTEQVTSRSLCG